MKHIVIGPPKKSLKIPKGLSESINRRRTDNIMAKVSQLPKRSIDCCLTSREHYVSYIPHGNKYAINKHQSTMYFNAEVGIYL
jgi:hypothetical protein